MEPVRVEVDDDEFALPLKAPQPMRSVPKLFTAAPPKDFAYSVMPMAPRTTETSESSPPPEFKTPPAIDSPASLSVLKSSMAFEIEPGTGEALSSRQHSSEPEATADGVLVYVKNGFMYAYGKVGEVFISVKVKIEAERELAMAKVVESYALVKAQVEKYGVTLEGYAAKLRGKALLVKGKVEDGAVYVKAKSIAARELVKTRATAGCEIMTTRATAGYEIVKTRAMAGYDVVKMNVNAGYVRICTAVQSLPVPVKVKNCAVYVQGKMGALFVYLRNGVMYVQGRVGDALVSVKMKGVASYELTAAKAHAAFASVATAVEPYTKKASEGLVSVKGKVNGVVVLITTKATEKVVAARGVYEIAQKAITDRVNSGKAIITDKVRDTVIYAKEGYVHIVSRASGKTLYIRAKVSAVGGEVKVKVLEAYVNVETLTFTIVDHLTAILESTKARAADKPVAASAMGGAVLVGAGGGAAGGVAGGVAGAAFGLPLALFTFGLSIPVCSVIGGGAGACVGAAVGGTAGAVGGGAAGYGYEHRAEIKSGMDGAVVKACDYKDKLKSLAASKLAKAGVGGGHAKIQ